MQRQEWCDYFEELSLLENIQQVFKGLFWLFNFSFTSLFLEPFDDELVVEPELTSEQISLRYWLQTIDVDHLPCPLCTRENSRRFNVQQLRV